MDSFRYLLIGLGFLCVVLGFIGIFIPLFPTTPFILLASFLFFRSSKRFHNWLDNHRLFGPYLQDWRRGKGFSRSRKYSMLALQGVITICTLLFAPWLIAKVVVIISFVSIAIVLKILPTLD